MTKEVKAQMSNEICSKYFHFGGISIYHCLIHSLHLSLLLITIEVKSPSGRKSICNPK